MNKTDLAWFVILVFFAAFVFAATKDPMEIDDPIIASLVFGCKVTSLVGIVIAIAALFIWALSVVTK